MLFQITHTHSHETCPAVHQSRLQDLNAWFESLKASPDVSLVGAYAAPLDHLLHITVEAPDLGAVVRALGPLNALGTAQTSPVLPLAELLSIARDGVSQL